MSIERFASHPAMHSRVRSAAASPTAVEKRRDACANTHRRAHVWLAVPTAVCLCALLAFTTRLRAGEPITLENPTTASAGGVVEAGEFRLAFTVGEAAASRVGAGEWTLVSGFLPTIVLPARGNDVFADSFESLPSP